MIVIGVSSGTSADGIDVAAARFALDGDLIRLTPLGHLDHPYPDDLRRELRSALPPASTTLETVCRLDTLIGREFGRAALAGMDAFTEGRADLISSHGQTLFHWAEGPTVHGTLQMGGPAWIAEATGVPVLSDPRTADVAAGGQGAPLAAVLDTLLLGERNEATAALNLGGIANVTVVRPGRDPLAFDTGPANALLDSAMRLITDGAIDLDVDGRLARSGAPVPELLDHLLAEPYYRQAPPKSTGPELFGPDHLEAALRATGRPDDGDLLATLVELTAVTVADALRPHGVVEVLASGGGIRNPAMMERLATRLGPARLDTVDALGLDGDAKEAYLFALIGFLSAHGLPAALPSCTGARHTAIAGSFTPGAGPLRLPEPADRPPRLLRVEPAP